MPATITAPYPTARVASKSSSAHVRGVITGLLLLLAGVMIGVFVTHEGASHTGELRLDVSLSHDRFAWFTAIADVIKVGVGPVVGPAVVILAAFALWFRHRQAALIMAGTTFFCWFATSAFKPLFSRTRPPAAQVHALVHETAPDSFPSGHTALSVAIMCGVFFAARAMGYSGRRVLLIGLPLTVIVAVSRLYLGAHYLGDVVASYFFVSGFACLLWAMAPWAQRRLTASSGK